VEDDLRGCCRWCERGGEEDRSGCGRERDEAEEEVEREEGLGGGEPGTGGCGGPDEVMSGDMSEQER